jgi:ubiquitin-like 1-activating enzyme E1 B
VLVVGAGGIGCELLKNLVCAGFGSGNTQIDLGASATQDDGSVTTPASRAPGIVLIDLDTIDLSNLNRQFLFRKQHIKKPKATVAKETASQFNPSVNIDARHGDIFDAEYNVDFFEGFDIVFNALDNLKARQHCNRMCMAAGVPLIESGTTGFNGQVQAIQKGVTECYDCNPKPVQKSFPICTIRSTPSQPIHCIVWAKSYLFPELFGTSEGDSDVAVTDADNAEEVVKLREEAQALKKIRSLMGTNDFAQAVFDKVFYEDIERLRSMSEMWQSRNPPTSLKFDSLKADTDLVKQGQALSVQDQRNWSVEENLAVFCYSLDILSNRAQSGEQDMSFDKDDKDTLDFVSAAANLRSHVFGIPTNSEWEIKQMAGNIIPAIATSNALTASLSVMLSYKVLRSKVGRSEAMAKPTANNSLPTTILSGKDESPLGGSKMVFLNSKSTERVITTQGLGRPDPRCPVCSPVYARLRIPKDTKPTLGHLVDEISAKLKYEEFQISTSIGVVYEPDLDDNLPRALSDLGVDLSSNGFITVTDDSDEPRVDLILSTSPHLEERGGIELDLGDLQELPYKPKAIVSANDLRIGDTSISDVMPMENTLQAMETATTNGHSEREAPGRYRRCIGKLQAQAQHSRRHADCAQACQTRGGRCRGPRWWKQRRDHP